MPLTETETQWLVDIHDEHAATLHRLIVLLGAEAQSGHILRSALLSLGRRGNRLVDPVERVEYLQEQVVHHARSVRGTTGTLMLPEVAESRQQEILAAIAAMPVRLGESLVISHYLSVFGPELAGILRMTVRASNVRLEEALERLRQAVGDPTPGSLPGVIESLSQEVTAALRSAARLVRPTGTETLESELRAFMREGRHGLSVWVVVPLLIGSLLVGLWLASLGSRGAGAQTTPSPTASTAPTATSSRSLPAQVRSVPVYYVGRTDGKLYRELRDLAATGDLVSAAVDALLALAPLDPDYDSRWGSGRLNFTQLTGHMLQVDLSASAFEGITTSAAISEAINQVVYTASEIIGDDELRVRFTVDGGAPPEGFATKGGFGRSGLEPMPALWLQSPRNGAVLPAGQLVIVGTVKPGATAPVVTVLDQVGSEVFSTTAQTATQPNSEGWRVWSVSIPDHLTAGGYTITAATLATDNKGAKTSFTETRAITIS